MIIYKVRVPFYLAVWVGGGCSRCGVAGREESESQLRKQIFNLTEKKKKKKKKKRKKEQWISKIMVFASIEGYRLSVISIGHDHRRRDDL
jgi:hypothetical protein